MNRAVRVVAPRLSPEPLAAPKERSPAVSPRENLADRIDRVVRSCTNGKIRGLKVEVDDEGIHLAGHCLTFYAKQLAQHAAMALSAGLPVHNDIVVQ